MTHTGKFSLSRAMEFSPEFDIIEGIPFMDCSYYLHTAPLEYKILEIGEDGKCSLIVDNR